MTFVGRLNVVAFYQVSHLHQISEMTAQMHEAVIKVIRRAARAARRRPPPEEAEFINIVMTGGLSPIQTSPSLL